MNPNAKSDLVEIACKVRSEREKSIAIWDGELESIDGREREKWTWLPKSQIEVDADAETVTMPEWLAVEKGLV